MIEDWKPQWTAKDIKTVATPLLFLISFVFGLYYLRFCSDMINTVPWYSTILIGPLMGAFGAGAVVYFMYVMAINACSILLQEINK
jgi:hypothetical protein